MPLPCRIGTLITPAEVLEPSDSAHPVFLPTGQREGKDQITEAETSDISSSVAVENRDTRSAQTLWLSRLPWLKNALVNAINVCRE